MRKYAIGADIGGSHISCAAVDLEKEQILKETFASQKIDNKASAEDILRNWSIALSKTISKIEKQQLAGIGFAMPGPFDYANGIALFTHEVAKYENLHGIHVAEKLKESLQLNGSDVRFMNDASAFAVGEAWLGKAAGTGRSLSVTLGTGFGSAFVDQGVPVVERTDVPRLGCVWHLPFKEGIADDSFSTRWFIKRYTEKTGKQAAGVKEIANEAVSNNSVMEIFTEFGNNLGELLGPWLIKFKADALVIGGNVSGAFSLFGKPLEKSLGKQNCHIRISISELMEDAAMIGSARMFNPDYWEKIKPLLSKM
jgi:glucokinase